MAVPKYDDFFEPVLELLSDGAEHARKDIREYCFKAKNLTDEDRMETIPSGQTKFINRTNWACSYLKTAGLVKPGAKKGVLSITDAGKEILANHKNSITLSLITAQPKYQSHIASSTSKKQNSAEEICDCANETAEERMGRAFKECNEKAKNDLREAVMNKEKMGDHTFQLLVKRLVEKMGYGSSKFSADIIKKGPDGGVDAAVVEDELGFNRVLIQTKRYAENNPVDTDDVKAFYATMTENGATKGVFCTTSKFHKSAYECVKNYKDRKIVLVDGDKLWELMLRYNVFVRNCETQYVLKEFDGDAFDEFIEEFDC